jgi:predicted outer membrane repeat protein
MTKRFFPASIPGHFGVVAGLLLLASASPAALALTVSVGNGGCNYIGLQFALDELASQPGPHVLKLKAQTIAIPDGLTINTSNTSYELRGGHINCSDANPTVGQRTVLDASGGDNGTAFAINRSGTGTPPTITLSRVTVKGGSSETDPFANPEGGGLEVRGFVTVRLNNATRIEDNASGKGGGAYLRGNGANRPALLQINGNSRITGNSAQTLGGGIYCDEDGTVYHDYGEVSFNVAGESGGGAYLLGRCRYDSVVSPGSYTGINNNEADYGAGLAVFGTGNVVLRGATNTPFWFLGNIALTDGGALYMARSGSTRTSVSLESTVFIDNRTDQGRAGAAMILAGGIDVVMRPVSGQANCSYFGVGYGACSAVIGNTSGNFAVGGIVHLVRNNEDASPDMTIENTSFVDNTGRAVLGLWRGGRFDVEGSLFTGNQVSGDSSVVWPGILSLDSQGQSPTPSRLAFSTVTGNTGSANAAIVAHEAAPLDLTGSIFYNPGLIGRSNSSGSVTHNGCLLVDASASYPTSPIPPRVGNPNLQSDLSLPSNSVALDICASTGAPSSDYRGNPRVVDQPGVQNVYGAVDLGAIERPADPPPQPPNLAVRGLGAYIEPGSTSTSAANNTFFGTIELGDEVAHEFELENTGEATLVISGHTVVGSCTNNFLLGTIPSSLAGDSTAVVSVRFDPLTAGDCTVNYQIQSNDTNRPTYTFNLRGIAINDRIFADGFE